MVKGERLTGIQPDGEQGWEWRVGVVNEYVPGAAGRISSGTTGTASRLLGSDSAHL